MTPADEKELHRLSDMLDSIDRSLDSASPLREALQKAGLALGLGFIAGVRSDIERQYQQLDAPLNDAERAHLRGMGIEPED